MDFGEALKVLRTGARVARAGWNGKGMWLVLVRPSGYPPLEARGEWADPKPLPWIGMKTADHGFVPWLASQTDILAEDWGRV